MLRVGAEYDNMSLYYNNMTRYITAPHVNIKRLGGGGPGGRSPGAPVEPLNSATHSAAD